MLPIRRRRLVAALVSLILVACSPTPTPTPSEGASATPSATLIPVPTSSPSAHAGLVSGPAALDVELVANGLDEPIGVTGSGDGSGRLFVNQRGGVVRVVGSDGSLGGEPFVDLTGRVQSGGERGLLGLAFHPQFATNGRLFVDYTRADDGATVVSELRATPDGTRADPDTERILLVVAQPYANHNGGQLAFGPDGYLYVGLGDGGGGGDPQGNGQNSNALLGKILRINIDSPAALGKAYAIPADNPFAPGGAAPGGGQPEIWALGLRNPWRFSFDAATGDLFIGDVGQGAWEEIDRQPGDSPGGLNYGWNLTEGPHCYQANCDTSGLVAPIAEYSHELGCAVTGGYVYRGVREPALRGVYIFGDYCSGFLFTLEVEEDGTFSTRQVAQTGLSIASFGVDDAGEVYLVDIGGGLYRVVPGA